MPGVEKRKDARIPVEFGAQVRKGSELYLGKVLNLSVSGMFLKIPTLFKEGDVLSVSFHIPKRKIQIESQAKVIWKSKVENSPTFGLGIQFEQMQTADRAALGGFIYAALKRIA